MTPKSKALVIGTTLVLVLLGTFPATAACTRPDSREIVDIEARQTTLVFHPLLEEDALLLRVTGPFGYTFEKLFEPRQAAVFEVYKDTADGCYTFEARLVPILSPEILEILDHARKTDDPSEILELQRAGKVPEYARVQAGGFEIVEGTIVLDEVPEKTFIKAGDEPDAAGEGLASDLCSGLMSPANGFSPKDYIINDDLIVDGSACVGFDCFNGWTFSYTTIGISENNLRFKFDDTSTAASYPRNDWWLVANDTANGGASRFSVEDCGEDTEGYCTSPLVPFTLEATAPSHSLYVDDYGRLGLGTSTPYVEIHSVDGDTPTLRLDQDGSSGFASQVWDVAGNETNFFIRDVTHGSKLSFRIQPGAPSNSLAIRSTGNVGLGTWSPDVPLHVLLGGIAFDAHDSTAVVIQNTEDAGDGVILSLVGGSGSGGNSQIAFGDSDDEFRGRLVYDHGSDDRFRFYTAGSVRMTLNNNTDTQLLEMSNGAVLTQGGIWQDASSRSLKRDIETLPAAAALAAVRLLEPVTFRFQNEDGERHAGFIAEDVPDLVASADRRHLSPMDIVAALTKVVQEQQEAIEELRASLAALENQPDS